MGYTPTEWHAGDTITSAKLNKLENAVASKGEVLYVEKIWDQNYGIATIDMSAEELYQATLSSTVKLLYYSDGEIESVETISSSYKGDGYFFYTHMITYEAATADERPHSSQQG